MQLVNNTMHKRTLPISRRMLLPQGLFTDTQQNGKDLPRRHGGTEREKENVM